MGPVTRRLAVLAVLWMVPAVHGQPWWVRGTVLDSATGEPLPAATVRLAGTYQAYPATGNAIGTGMVGEESFRVDSRGTDTNNLNYVGPFYTADNCIAPCQLNAAIAPSLRSGQLGYSSFYDVELMPQDTVKYLPHWTTLDLSIARTFNTGGWSWEARLDAFNALNNGIELRHRSGSRGRRLNDATFEQAQAVLVGRVLRVTFAARF